MTKEFQGIKPEAYMFLTELGFNNNRQWVEENRWRYKQYLQQPLNMMAELLLPTALEIDPGFNTRLGCIVSRLNRDTRFSKNKLPYRDNLWIGFRKDGQSTGESLCIYFEISPAYYGYGVGVYSGNTDMMNRFRAHALADTEGFRKAFFAPGLERYALVGDAYKKDRFPAAPEDIKPYLNMKGLSLCYANPSLAPTMGPGILDEVKGAMLELAPVYKFILGMK